MRTSSAVFASCLLVGSMLPSAAHACGGCFAPTETQQVVTDHRMVMAIHQDESLLWDQIRYSGRPEEFAWILPVRGDVQISLASARFFDQLDAATAVTVTAPVVSCPRSGSGSLFSGEATATLASNDRGGVQVLQTSVVGPYQTVTLRSSSTDALTAWLRDNRYAIPAAIEPTIRWYNDMHMDFVAMRLRPGENVTAMQPVRIRFATPSTVLPLRMVAAGVADKVGITLFVFGQGRYEAQNFANGSINPDEVVWDYATNSSNYARVFSATLRRLNNGRGWISESAGIANQYQGVFVGDAATDFAEAVRGLSSPWVTRMRTDLTIANLDADLTLASSASNVVIPTTMNVTRTVNRPPCATDDGFYSGADNARGGLITCSVGLVGHAREPQWALGLLGLALAARRRRNV